MYCSTDGATWISWIASRAAKMALGAMGDGASSVDDSSSPRTRRRIFGLVLLRRVLDQDVEEEPVHLGFGKRIRPLLLDGVLRGRDHEQLGEWMRRAGNRDLTLFHGLEERGLHLGRRPVDLVAQDEVAEDRPRVELELASPALCGVVDLRSRNVGGKQVRRELDARQRRIQVAGEALHGARLRESGQPFQQDVTVGEQPEDQALDHVVLPDDGARDPLLK